MGAGGLDERSNGHRRKSSGFSAMKVANVIVYGWKDKRTLFFHFLLPSNTKATQKLFCLSVHFILSVVCACVSSERGEGNAR